MKENSVQTIRAAARNLLDKFETERKKEAIKIHEVSQDLSALTLLLAPIRRQLKDNSPVAKNLKDCFKLAEESIRNLKSLITELRPAIIDDFGLVAALRWYGEQFASRTGVTVDVVGDEASLRFSRGVEINLFRIAQEAFRIIEKHAKSTQVKIVIKREKGGISLAIIHDGIILTHSKVDRSLIGWKFQEMSERTEFLGGVLSVRSQPGTGTKVTVEVPG